MIKSLLNYIHAALKNAAHVLLIPVVALLKATITGLTHLETELTKI